MITEKHVSTQAGKQAVHTGSSQPADIKSLEKKSIYALEDALAAVRELSVARFGAKMSVSRLTGVARELRELIKVMSVYGC